MVPLTGPQIHASPGLRPRGESNPTILLNRHSNQLSPKFFHHRLVPLSTTIREAYFLVDGN